MIWGRKPVCSNEVVSAARPKDTTAYGLTDGINTTSSIPIEQPRNTCIYHGNRLKHDKNNLLQADFSKEKRRWHCLEETIRHIVKRERDRAYYPGLQPFLVHRSKKDKHGNKTTGGRKVRPERLESALNLLMPWLLKTLNLRAMVCGYYEGHYNSNSRFISYDYGYFVAKTGLTLNRIKRCMKYLKSRGIVRVHRIVKETEKGIRTESVFIRLSSAIFKMAGTYKEFLIDRERVKKKHEKIEGQERRELRRLEGNEPHRDFSGRCRSYLPPRQVQEANTNKIQNIISKAAGLTTPLPYERKAATAYGNASHKPRSNSTNPYQDINILMRAQALIKDTPKREVSEGVWKELDLKEAVRRVCLQLGKSPPDH